MSVSTSSSFARRRRRFSLTARVSIILVLAVVLPLLITVVGSEVILRPTLLSQAATEMRTDAQTHAQAIDSLLIARLEDVEYIGHYLAIQKFLAGDQTFKAQALSELAMGYRLDANYSTWTLFDTHGAVRLSYPAAPTPRGKYMIPPEIMQQLQTANKTVISNTYYNPDNHSAFIDIYTSIAASNGSLLGVGRSTLQLTDIWTAVNNETNAAPGSYAMVLDNHGIRIAYTNIDTTLTTLPQGLFKAVGPLSSRFKQQIASENLYGNSIAPVSVLADPSLASTSTSPQDSSTFQLTPALQSEPFEAYRVTTQVVPWTYVVLRPVNTITKAANQQDIYLILLAAIVTVLTAIIGLVVGRGITRPILRSVASLLSSSQKLKAQSAREQVTASEQQWIVESSQAGLKAVQYYTEATGVAAHRLDKMGGELMQNLERMNVQQVKQRLGEIITTAHYIEQASSHQERSSKSLATAIRITTQVTEQLVVGANSASEAANSLEDVITQLRQVVGE